MCQYIAHVIVAAESLIYEDLVEGSGMSKAGESFNTGFRFSCMPCALRVILKGVAARFAALVHESNIP